MDDDLQRKELLRGSVVTIRREVQINRKCLSRQFYDLAAPPLQNVALLFLNGDYYLARSVEHTSLWRNRLARSAVVRIHPGTNFVDRVFHFGALNVLSR